MHKIVLADLVKRAFAAILDLVFAVFIGLGFFALVQYAFLSSASAGKLKQAILDESIASSLYRIDSDGNAVSYDGTNAHNSYEFYQGIVYSYYVDYLPTKGVAHDTYWYNVHILGLEDSKNLYPNDTVAMPSLLGSALWMYSSSGVDVLGVPKAEMHIDNDLSKDLSDSGKASLLTFYHDSTGTTLSVYYNALSDLSRESFYSSLRNHYSLYSVTYPLVIAVPLAALIFYLVIPLCFANGETLAKKLLSLGLVSRYGFKVSKGQVVMRQLPSILLVSVPFLFLSPIQSGALILGMLLVSYAFVVFGKEHKALHDYWGATEVIDTKESLFFANAEEQAQAEAQYQALMAQADQRVTEGKENLENEKTLPNDPPKD